MKPKVDAATDNTVVNSGLKPWKPGESGNPKGRPKGSKSKIAADYTKSWQL